MRLFAIVLCALSTNFCLGEVVTQTKRLEFAAVRTPFGTYATPLEYNVELDTDEATLTVPPFTWSATGIPIRWQEGTVIDTPIVCDLNGCTGGTIYNLETKYGLVDGFSVSLDTALVIPLTDITEGRASGSPSFFNVDPSMFSVDLPQSWTLDGETFPLSPISEPKLQMNSTVLLRRNASGQVDSFLLQGLTIESRLQDPRNLKVTLTTVPEPSSFLFLALVAPALWLKRFFG